MVSVGGTVLQRVYLGMTTQVTISLGGEARLVARDTQSYRASVEERWEPGMDVRLGWLPEHCLVLS
jgi:spermidine/putrescine transport system ATP-binding protein